MTPGLSEEFIESLPTPEAARTFMARLFEEHPDVAPICQAHPALLAHLLVLATHSPYLGEVLLAHPEYIHWLATEDLERVKPKEDLFQDLARWATMQSDQDLSRILFRFKQRQMLRIYVRDCLRWATLAETMRELSDLADVILQYALWRSWQELVERYGRPEVADARGRLREAEFAIVALGKLGSQELNYASDIDLFYLYSGDGWTSSQQMTNREFFTKLAERITRLVGGLGPEGAVYRVDLRLRPRGRDGDLVVTLPQAVTYYRTQARNWERQTLLRARAAAGSEALVREFLARVEDVLYRPEPLAEILDDIRMSKERLDQEKASSHGLDIKLGRGGIREIEFIVQALQLYHGGRDPWVRHPQILIGLGRLADKGWVNDRERAHLAEAYIFFRTLEHRLQMEHGVRTHTLSLERERLQLAARRMGYTGGEVGEREFLRDLERHRRRVMRIFERVFREKAPPERAPQDASLDALAETAWRDLARSLRSSALSRADVMPRILAGLQRAPSPKRAVTHFSAWIAGLSRAQTPEPCDRSRSLTACLPDLLHFFGTSDFLSQMLIRYPQWLWSVRDGPNEPQGEERSWYADRFRRALGQEPKDEPREYKDELARAMSALRRAWTEELLRIGYRDVTGQISLRRANVLQTALAAASLEIACEVAFQTLRRRYGASPTEPVFTIFGLGRLGHNGVDYGSDLDIIVVYEDGRASPLPTLSPQQAYASLVALLIHILSTITHEGYLYRLDVRLRPEGQASPLALSASVFLEYLQEKAAIWERLAYLKAFPVVGDADFGRALHAQMQARILRPRPGEPETLAPQVHQMRERIEREKAWPTPERNFKFGRGGMMDVYFATRYLQLRHQIPEPEERGTIPLIAYLRERGVLTGPQSEALSAGYLFLRRLDHALRLLRGRSEPVFPSHRALLEEVAACLGYSHPEHLTREHAEHRHRIRSAYEEIVRPSG